VSELKLEASGVSFRRGVVGRLQVAAGALFLALMAANTQGLLPMTDHPRVNQWFGPIIAAGTVLLGLVVILMIRGVTTRLDR
jgi:hypothetical protein